jgi:hypothetical protein
MRIFTIALLLLVINVGINLAAYSNLLAGAKEQGDLGLVNSTSQWVKDQKYPDSITDNAADRTQLESDYLRSLWGFIDLMKGCAVPYYTMTNVLGMDSYVSLVISAIIYLFYAMAIIQLLRNISGEGAI